MRLCLSIIAIVLLTLPTAKAEPLVTISCDKPNGFRIEYGTTPEERFEASQKNQPSPPPTLSGPNKDSYLGTPTFIIDSNKTKMTVVWAELPEDLELRKRAKELDLPLLPPTPPAAAEASVVMFFRDQISAVQVEAFLIMTYSFFPKLGTAFIGEQNIDSVYKNTTQIATFAHCEFSWTSPKDDPRNKR
jgi:hypothetical protein